MSLRRIVNLITHIQDRGFAATARYARERIIEFYHERRLGICTSGLIPPKALGIDNPFSVEYYPCDYRSIFEVFKRLHINPDHDVFLDYGCGKGRVLAVAATHPFRRVIGVELSPHLCRISQENLDKARPKLRCLDIEIVAANAAAYRVPSNVTVIFFYNPFHGPVLISALGAIRESLLHTPRRLTIVFKNIFHLIPLLKEHPWLVRTNTFQAGDGDHQVAIFEAGELHAAQDT